MRGQQLGFHMRPVTGLDGEICRTEKFGKIAIPRIIFRQQRQHGRPLAHHRTAQLRRIEIHGKQATDDRLHACLRQCLADLVNAEEIVDVGDGDRRHRILERKLRQLRGTHRALEQRVRALHPQMNKAGRFARYRHHSRLLDLSGSIRQRHGDCRAVGLLVHSIFSRARLAQSPPVQTNTP